MKFDFIRPNLFKAICVLGITNFANLATAHTFSGAINGNGGVSVLAAATDYYQLTCDQSKAAGAESTLPAAKMVISIRDTTAGASLVGVTLSKPDTASGPNAPANNKSQTTIDAVGGADPVYSPEVSIAGGEGVYYATVFHTGNSTDNFASTFHCLDAAGVHSGTAAALRISNQ